MKLLFPKQNYNVLSPRSYTHIKERFIYSRVVLPVLLRKICGPILGIYNLLTAHECGNWDWAQFPEKEYINGIFVATRFFAISTIQYSPCLTYLSVLTNPSLFECYSTKHQRHLTVCPTLPSTFEQTIK
jgi:hypothetical protein